MDREVPGGPGRSRFALLGALGFFLMAGIYIALPRGVRWGGRGTRGVSQVHPRGGELRGHDRLTGRRGVSVEKADESTSEKGTRTDPKERLALLLTRGPMLHGLDLSQWRAVDMLALNLMGSLPRVVGAEETDAVEFQRALPEARSVRVRQFLLVVLGVLGPGEAASLEEYLDMPGMRASCAYALGRSGEPAAEESLSRAIAQAPMGSPAIEALYFGLAQLGPDLLPRLLAASDAFLLAGSGPGDALPVEFMRHPEARPALREVALGPSHPLVRAAAIRGFLAANRVAAIQSLSGPMQQDPVTIQRNLARAMMETAGNAAQWMQDLVARESEDVAVRVEALRALGVLDAERCAALASRFLEQGSVPAELLAAAMDGVASAGVPEGSVDLFFQLALDPSETTRANALRALVATGGDAIDERLAQLLPQMDRAERTNLLVFLGARDLLGKTTSGKLLESIYELLEDPVRIRGEEELVFTILAASDTYADRVRDRAWDLVAAAPAEERNATLARLARFVGPEANENIMQAFDRETDFLPRVELAASLANIQDNMDRPAVSGFFEDHVLPMLRDELPRQTGAPLASIGPGSGMTSAFAMSIANVFGRFGTPEDVSLLESLGPTFLRQQSDWPDALRTATHEALSEAAARAIDLIHLRTQGSHR